MPGGGGGGEGLSGGGFGIDWYISLPTDENWGVMRIRIIFSLSVMQFQTFLELPYNL